VAELKLARKDLIEHTISAKGTEFYALTDRGRAYLQHIAINLGACTIEQFSDYLGMSPAQLKACMRDVPEIALIIERGRTYQVAKLTTEGIRYALSGDRNSPRLIAFFLQALAPEVYGDNPTTAGQSPILKELGISISESVRQLKDVRDNAGKEVTINEESGHIDTGP